MSRSPGSDRTAGLASLGAFAVSVGILVAAGAYATRQSWPWRDGPPPEPVTVADLFTETVDTLRRGETLSQLFQRQGLESFTLSTVSGAEVFNPRRLRPGLVFTFQRRPADSVVTRVVVRTTAEQRVALVYTADGWEAVAEPIAWRAEPVAVHGVIETSLYEALDAEVPDSLLGMAERIRLAWDLADIYAWQVDFGRDIRTGDRFRVLAERLVSEDGEVRYGRILAGDLTVAGQRYTAYRFTGPEGATGFYDAEGRSLRRAFLLAPVQFRRISSRVSRARRHPILGIVRRHDGIDYSAAAGTPVMAAGDGVVTRREWSGGYGNLVELRHVNGIVTRYGHLRGFARGLATGQRVTQGEVIGYVGSTGLATASHLHYEFRVNGVARDPRGVDLGNGNPVPLAQIRDFERQRSRLEAFLAYPEGVVPLLADLPEASPPPGPAAAGASF